MRSIVTELATREIFRHPRGAVQRIVKICRDHRSRRRVVSLDDSIRNSSWTSNQGNEFEVAPDVPDSLTILFLTRVFNPDAGWNATNREYVESLNLQRAEIIRVFRRHFGKRFIGGLVPGEYAREKFSDCLADVSTIRSDYLRLLRNCRVAITTKGLVDSIPAKLAEYVAASRCILSDPLRYTLPFEIRHGEHAMFFERLGEGIEYAERLLTDDDLAFNMRMNNYKLYQEHVRPSAAMWRCINSAMQAPRA